MKYCEEHGHKYGQVLPFAQPEGSPHAHFYVCTQCGQLLKFDLDKIEASGQLK